MCLHINTKLQYPVQVNKPETPNPRVLEAANLFDDSVILGAMLSSYGAVEDSELIYHLAGRQYKDIIKRAQRLRGLKVVYSGVGFMPVEDETGYTVTGYTKTDSAVGYLDKIYIADRDEIQHMEPDQVEVEDEDLVDSNIDLIDPVQQALLDFRNQLLEAPTGLRLFVEFMVRHEMGVDQPIRGHAIRTPEYSVFNIMDAAGLEVLDIAEPEEEDKFNEYLISEALIAFSDHYRQQIRKKGFRNQSAEKQKKIIEKFFDRCNSMLDLKRFNVETDAQILFVPCSDSELESVKAGFETVYNHHPFVGDCVRFDCVESAYLNSTNEPIRKRKGNFNSFASTCVVVEIDDETKEGLGLDSNIIWLPVTNQMDDIEFSLQYSI